MDVRWRAESDPLPTILSGTEGIVQVSKVPTGVEDSGSFKTSHDGYWQADPDSPLMYREDYRGPEDWWRPVTMRPMPSRQRRKCFETWTEGGQPVGRWVWEYRPTP